LLSALADHDSVTFPLGALTLLALGVLPPPSARAFEPTAPVLVRAHGAIAEAIGAAASTESTAATTTAMRAVAVSRTDIVSSWR
jgi:hypothetical protein